MTTQTAIPTARDFDGLALIGRTTHDLRGIRFDEGEGGNTPPAATPPTPTPGEVTPPAATPPVPTPPAPTASVPAAWDGKIESLDPAAQKIITDLRTEAANNRVKATNAENRTQAILKAAGLVDETDPVEALRTTAAERDTFKSAAQEAARKLAIFRAAGPAGANADALLDSNTFLASVSSLDPASADFSTQVAAAITAAVTANPTLKAGRAPGASTVETPGGTGEQGQITEAQLAQMTPEQISDAYDKGLLKSLLG